MKNSYPLIHEFAGMLRKSMMPFLAEAVGSLSTDAAYCDAFENMLHLVRTSYPDKPWPKWAVNGTLRFNRSVIQAELAFRKSGEYDRKPDEADAIADEIYGSPEVMEGYYLVGLLMTYFTWPHHSEILDFYRAYFLAGGSKPGTVMEWGVGHGLFTLLASRAWPQADITALDISPHSLNFARRLIEADGAGPRSRFVVANILGLGIDLPQVDRLICSELIEHVADPDALCRRIAGALAPQGRAFLTVAINAPQPDHIYLFRSRDEVEQLVAANGLSVEAALPVVHPNNQGRECPPIVLAMIVAKAC